MSAQRSAWNYYPWAVVAAFVLVFAVNGTMAWDALSTFPGVAVKDDFDHSNQYNRILATAAQEAAHGWQVTATAPGGHAALVLADKAGQPLRQVTLIGHAVRPVGPDHATPLTFREVAPGRYLADQVLTGRGQWELRVIVRRGADTLHMAPRVLVQ